MVKKLVKVNLKTGLHARPAALFVQEANKFSCDISIEKDEKVVNAKSIMGIMSLAINSGSEIYIITDGVDEEQAAERLAELVSQED
ncbi:hypothetical protein BHF71_10995 [Vulcanibacillus modesticaldus]|uniref:Phosphocarrier protein HPr n=1 Tax=Vulcanibacillus modesticaldus TaxID=337097 RepID=A0A1D2YSS5_9BACI|nr:HPr family phosphocarrier protein [Vulcanibacillus modesticaldus]OEF97790.1 hypothetical protein BHF71_10995 [Vulcanibacillus modesticaldus]